MDLVFPGVELIFARSFLLNIEFIKDDLPTLDLPHNIISGIPSPGSWETLNIDLRNT